MYYMANKVKNNFENNKKKKSCMQLYNFEAELNGAFYESLKKKHVIGMRMRTN